MESLKSSSAETMVFVVPGKLIPVLTSPNYFNLRFNESMVLDASGSYDEDEEDGGGGRGTLRYHWVCVRTSPSFNATCPVSLSPLPPAPTDSSDSDVGGQSSWASGRYALLSLTISYYILLYLTISYYILLYLTISYYILLYLTIP